MNNIRMKPRSFIASPEMDNVVDEAVKRAAKEMAEEIDFQVLANLYKESGWTEVEFNPHVEDILAYKIQNWMRDTLKGHYTSRGKRWLFENKQDAAWFILRWK